MGVLAELKSINELVKAGFEVSVDNDYIHIHSKKGSNELEVRMYNDLIGYGINLRKDGTNYHEINETHSHHDGDSIPNTFLKNIEDNTAATFELENHTLELGKDKTIKVGCENIDAKLALKIGKAILKANGYDISG